MARTMNEIAFLVATDEATYFNSKLLIFLEDEGFNHVGKGMFDNCPWVFIDLNKKVYAYGMPGIPYTGVIGGHAIKLSEFYTIYNIYKQYEGKELFVFKSKRFDYDD